MMLQIIARSSNVALMIYLSPDIIGFGLIVLLVCRVETFGGFGVQSSGLH